MKNRIVPVVFAVVAALGYGMWSPAVSGDRTPPPGGHVATRITGSFDPSMAVALDARLSQLLDGAGLPSLSAALATPEGGMWTAAQGWADIDGGVRATPGAMYRTGSMAKPITAVAMMRLAARGALQLDAPLGQGIAGLPAASQAITPRQLASHTAGIRHYTLVEAISSVVRAPVHYPSVQDGLSVFIRDPLLFKPGAGFTYSTYGYSLLSRQLEVAARLPFPAVLKQEVLDPCGMTRTALDAPGPMPDRVQFYRTANGHYKPAKRMDSSARIAGGGLVSTPGDLAKFGQCVLSDSLLSADARQTMWTVVTLPDGAPNPQNYGLGWRIDNSTRLLGPDRPTPIIHHGGQQEGGAGFLLLIPGQKLSVAVMTNSGTDEAREAVQEAAYALVRTYTERKAREPSSAGIGP